MCARSSRRRLVIKQKPLELFCFSAHLLHGLRDDSSHGSVKILQVLKGHFNLKREEMNPSSCVCNPL